MERKKFGALLDETVSQMESDVRVLKNKQVVLKTNVSELEKERDRLSEEIAILEKTHVDSVKKCKEEAESIMEAVKEKLKKASVSDSQASGKLAELNDKIKESDDIIKSNKGLQKSLESQNEEIKKNKDILSNLIETINKTIELI
jgi:chromosome segregation ATPase